jgi:hypothetical protein
MLLTLNDKHKMAMAVSLRPSTRLVTFEGTIRSSKTVCAIQIFALRCLMSNSRLNLISAQDEESVRNTILKSNGLGLTSLYPDIFTLRRDKIGAYYVSYKNMASEDCEIMLVGYAKCDSWKKIVGKTIGNIFVDEANIADPDFIKECFSRQADVDHPFTIWTLNGDNPEAFIYSYINQCKPLLDVPDSILEEMAKVPKLPGRYYFHWKMEDNPNMTPDKIEAAESIYPINSYYYNVRILGIRGRAEGTIFAQFLNSSFIKNVLYTPPTVLDNGRLKYNGFVYDGKEQYYIRYTIGLDIGNNEIKRGTVVTITGLTEGYREADVLYVKECVSTEINALVDEITDYVHAFYKDLPNKASVEALYADSYGPIELMTKTLQDRFRLKGMGFPVLGAGKFGKKEGRRARMDMMMFLVGSGRIRFLPSASGVIKKLSRLTYAKDGLPEDENQPEMDYYDSLCYSLVSHIVDLTRNGGLNAG